MPSMTCWKVSAITYRSLTVSGQSWNCPSWITELTMVWIIAPRRSGVGSWMVRQAASVLSASMMMPISRVSGRGPG